VSTGCGVDRPGRFGIGAEPERVLGKSLDGLGVEHDLTSSQVLLQVGQGRSSGDEKNVGGPVEQPGQGHLGRGDGESAGRGLHRRGRQDGLLTVEGRSQWKERNEGDLIGSASSEDVLAGHVGQVVGVLDTGDGDGGQGGTVLIEINVAQSDASDQSFLTEGLHELGLFGDGDVRLGMSTQVDHRHLLDVESGQIGFDSRPQLLGALGGQPLALIVPRRTDLGHQNQIVGIGMKCLPNQLVGHVGTVELCCVDVVYASLDGAPEDGQGGVSVLWWTENPRAGKLHGAEPHAAHRMGTEQDGFFSHGCRYTRKVPLCLPIQAVGSVTGTVTMPHMKMVGPSAARRLAVALAAGRVGVGGVAVLAPRVMAKPWIGERGNDPMAAVLARALGGRDLALGLGVLMASRGGQPLRGWVEAGALADLVDAAVTLAAFGRLPNRGRLLVLAAAGGAATVGAVAARAL
jgi:hypothetical protein